MLLANNLHSDVYKTASLTGEQYGKESNRIEVATKNVTPGTYAPVYEGTRNINYQPLQQQQQQQEGVNIQNTSYSSQRESRIDGSRQLHGAWTVNGGQSTTTTSVMGGEEKTRKISSTIVENTTIGAVPEDKVRYVEVPVYEEELEFVTVKETRVVPSTQPAQVEVKYVDKIVEVPVEQEVIVEVPVPNRLGPIINTIYVDSAVPPEPIYNKRYVDKSVPRFIDHEVPVIVAQMSRPMIREDAVSVDVAAKDYQPEIVPVDIHLVRPVENTLQLVSKNVRTTHKLAEVGPALYNSLLKSLNAGTTIDLPYVSQNGRIEYVPESECRYTLAPAGVKIEGWTPQTAKTTTGYLGSLGESSTGVGMLNTSSTAAAAAGGLHYSSGLLNTASSKQAVNSKTGMLVSGESKITTRRETGPLMNAEAAGSRGIEEGSSSSSVSSSINKIANQLQSREKKRYMCCGTTNAHRVSRSPGGAGSLEITGSAAGVSQYTYPSEAQGTTTITAGKTRRPAPPSSFAQDAALNSHVVSVTSAVPPPTRETRVC